MESITVITHYSKDDKQFLGDYQAITIKNDRDFVMVEYGNEALDKGNEKAQGFIEGITYVLTDLTVEYKNVADYEGGLQAWKGYAV